MVVRDVDVGEGVWMDTVRDQLPGSRGQALPLPLPLLRLMGSAAGALFVAQLLAWETGDEAWQACSYSAWQAELGISEYRIKKVAAWCAACGFLETRIGDARGVPVTYYKLRLQPLTALLAELIAAGGGQPGVAGAQAAAAWRQSRARI
jgi:hypothetical protein